MGEASIHFLDRYPRPAPRPWAETAAPVIPIDGDPALMERRRTARAVAAWSDGRVAPRRRWDGPCATDARLLPPASAASVIPFPHRPGSLPRSMVPPGGAELVTLSFVRDDRLWEAICRQALGLPGTDTECAVYGLRDPAPGPDAA